MLTDKQIEELLETLTLDEMIGQMLCYNLTMDQLDELEKNLRETHAGSVFVAGNSKEEIAKASAIVRY